MSNNEQRVTLYQNNGHYKYLKNFKYLLVKLQQIIFNNATYFKYKKIYVIFKHCG